jgi:hypothetical protein
MGTGRVAFAALLGVACGSSRGGVGGDRAAPADIASALERAQTIDDLRADVATMCGARCACMVDDPTRCGFVCSGDARAKAKAAAPGARVAALVAACGASHLGLSADDAPWASEDWLVAYEAGEYLGDQFRRADGHGQQIIGDAMAGMSLTLAPPVAAAGLYTLPAAKNTQSIGRPRRAVLVDAKGAVSARGMPTAILGPNGAQLSFVEADEPIGPGTKMALDEGKMGKKEEDQPPHGTIEFKPDETDPAVARAEAIEALRAAGMNLQVQSFPAGGGSVAPAGPDDDLILADAATPASAIVKAIGEHDGGALLGVDGGGHVAAMKAVFFGINGFVEYTHGPALSIVVGTDAIVVQGARRQERGRAKPGDLSALAEDLAHARANGLGDRADVDVMVKDGTTYADLIGALDAAVGAGLDTIAVEVWTPPPPPAGPTIFPGHVDAEGDLDTEQIRRTIVQHRAELNACDQQAFAARPQTTDGVLLAEFTILADGTVRASSAKAADTDLASCVATLIRGFTFPKPGSEVAVHYTFTLRAPDPDWKP